MTIIGSSCTLSCAQACGQSYESLLEHNLATIPRKHPEETWQNLSPTQLENLYSLVWMENGEY